jgi:hypothetical protein
LLPHDASRNDDTPAGTKYAATASALFLVLVTPFVVFLNHHHYSLLNAEIAACFGIAAASALIVAPLARWPVLRVLAISFAVALAIDAQFTQLGQQEKVMAAVIFAGVGWVLREHLATIVALTSLTFLVATIGLGTTPEPTTLRLTGGNPARPFVLHVVLDEHVGFAGMPRGARYDASIERLNSFFERYDFRRFNGAYSEYFWTRYTFSQMLNFSYGRYTPGLFRVGTNAQFELVENKYFARLAEEGYSVNVFQTTYLDSCADPRTVAQCETFEVAGIRELQFSQLDWTDRFFAVSTAYLNRLFIYGNLWHRVTRMARTESAPQWLPAWAMGPIRALPPLFTKVLPEHYGPVAARALTARLIEAVSGARRGQYVFAHLMLTHYPYVYLPDCSLRRPAEWNSRTDPDAPPDTSNTVQGREERYVQYLDQMQCAYKDLGRLLDAIPEELQHDAVVILHGDHGSRINIIAPGADNSRTLTPRDFSDSYSTLFAVKSPAVPAGDDGRLVAIGCVLATFLESEFTRAAPDPSCDTEHKVFKVPFQSEVIAATAVAAPYRP